MPKRPRGKSLELLASLGLLSFYASPHDEQFRGSSLTDREGWSQWAPEQRIELPTFVPDVTAGAPSPVRLTRSKIAALKLVARIEVRGFVVPQDFRDLGIDSRRWTNPASGLLQFDGQNHYVRGEKLIFDQQHPRVFAEIVEVTRRKLAGPRAPCRHDL